MDLHNRERFMKQSLLALSLIATLPLIAEEQAPSSPPIESQVEEAACEKTCCEPKKCCCPRYGYLPAYYDLECDWGAFITVDFLYWYAKESNLSYASKIKAVQTGDATTVSTSTYKSLDGEWDPGFRVGLGWNMCHDGWDLYLNWTYYNNSSKSSTSVPDFGQATDFYLPSSGQEALINPWINASFHFNDTSESSARLFDKVVAQWDLYLNQIDLELGRRSWVSPCFSMRPYAALRGAWVKTKFNTTSSRTTFDSANSENVQFTFKDRFKSKYWGVGFLVGFQPAWHFSNSFMLYSNFDGALIWGDFDTKKREMYLDQRSAGGVPVPQFNTSSQSKSCFSDMQAILDLSLGLRWERTWCCNRYRTALDLGWEHHMWFDFDHHYQTQGHFSSGSVQGFSSFNEVISDLMMGGLTLRLKFDF